MGHIPKLFSELTDTLVLNVILLYLETLKNGIIFSPHFSNLENLAGQGDCTYHRRIKK